MLSPSNNPTFRHVVSWKYKNNVTDEVKGKIIEELKILPFQVEGIVSFILNHDIGKEARNAIYKQDNI